MTTPEPDQQPSVTTTHTSAPPLSEQPTAVHSTPPLAEQPTVVHTATPAAAVPQTPVAHQEPPPLIPAQPSPSDFMQQAYPPAMAQSVPTPPNGMQPQHPQMPQPVARPSRAPIIALTTLAAVFAIVAGLFTVLYVGETSDRDQVAATRADKEGALSDLTEKQDEADNTLETNRSRESTLTSEHDLLTQCVDAAKAYFDLPPEQSPESSRLFRIMYDVCPQI
ncbi:hypothetical protein [Saccharothrix deserti]|uniref:hypothetical protein n=1 Tax=Saccharothrix deserti TaxID=2593674 RepID=UPI00131EBE1F|nr:hypothetical protein [Saccharothrix deserti]